MSRPIMKGRLSVYLRLPRCNRPSGLGLLAEAHRRTPLVLYPVLAEDRLYGCLAEGAARRRSRPLAASRALGGGRSQRSLKGPEVVMRVTPRTGPQHEFSSNGCNDLRGATWSQQENVS